MNSITEFADKNAHYLIPKENYRFNFIKKFYINNFNVNFKKINKINNNSKNLDKPFMRTKSKDKLLNKTKKTNQNNMTNKFEYNFQNYLGQIINKEKFKNI
jgi:hypothetical protein